jgi:CRISPR-associated endoribonuclease Cas6
MAFLELHLQVKTLQKEISTGEHRPCCHHLYNALLNTLEQFHEARAVRPNQRGTDIHIAVSLLKCDANLYKIRVTVSGQRAIPATHVLLSAFDSKPVMCSESQSYQVLSINLARTPLGSVTTWADLLVPSSELALRLRFLSPTIFKGVTEGLETGELFPQPLFVFSGLHRKWDQLGGPPLADEVSTWLQDHTCFVSDYRLQAEPIAVRSETGSLDIYTGWKGWITYTSRQPQVVCMSTLRTLARMACFTGVGAYTEIGMGVTRIEEEER